MSTQNNTPEIEGYDHSVFMERLEDLRKRSNISRKKLAMELDLSYSTYQRWYREDTTPREKTIEAIASYFHCDPRYLYKKDFETVDLFGESFKMEKERFYTNHKDQIAFLESLGYVIKYLPAGGSGDRFGNTDVYEYILIIDPEKNEYYHDEFSFQNLFKKIKLQIQKELIDSSESYGAYKIKRSIEY